VLRLLLDEHLSPDITAAVQRIQPGIDVISVYRWEDGRYSGKRDDDILIHASEQGLTLVTYDLKTIPLLLVRWGERGVVHAGVIFGDDHTVAAANIGGVARALVQMWEEQGGLDWTNHIAYLNRAL
jgi:hypothetical protein